MKITPETKSSGSRILIRMEHPFAVPDNQQAPVPTPRKRAGRL
jgi:hypothetical protein